MKQRLYIVTAREWEYDTVVSGAVWATSSGEAVALFGKVEYVCPGPYDVKPARLSTRSRVVHTEFHPG